MKQTKHAGMSGKGFYAALSLSVAMVGAACWYAYSETGKLKPPTTAESSLGDTQPAVTASTAPATSQTTSAATAVTTTRRTVTVTTSRDAEEAAALITKETETSAATTETAATTAPVEQQIMPIDGKLLEPFSRGELVKSATTGIWQTHNGADFAAPLGTEVVSVADGTVIAIEREAIWGVCVSVLHDDGTVTRYCGLNEGLEVTAGEVLERGKVIGAVGDTNEAESALEAHLHFEVLQNDEYVDPEAYLGATASETIPDAAQ